jgi:hypothetical protein
MMPNIPMMPNIDDADDDDCGSGERALAVLPWALLTPAGSEPAIDEALGLWGCT